ncbi:hypothetical protein [Emticicia fontis]
MTPEEKDIKNKIDNLSDLDLFFNDSDLWERVEERLEQKKSRKNLLAWYWAAASLVVGSTFYFFLSPTDTPQSTYGVTKNTATISTTTEKPTIVARLEPSVPKVLLRKNNTIQPVLANDSVETKEFEERLLTLDVARLQSIDKPIESTTSKDLGLHPIAFKAQRVTSLILPVIPDRMMERESFAKRALRQMKHFNTEGKVDLRELNIEPRNVWAYLERSFFHDTTKVTNTKPPKK